MDDEDLKERLLGQLTNPAEFARYRSEVHALLETNARAFRREKVAVQLLWIGCVVLSIGFLWFDGAQSVTPKGPWLALFTFLLGAIQLIKHAINRSRLDVLAEVKQVQVQLLDVREAIGRAA